MLFSALWVCPRCGLRGLQRARCSCGNDKLLSLRREHGRQWFRKAAARTSLRYEWAHRLADWAPKKPWLAFVLVVLMALPAIFHLAKGRPPIDMSLTSLGFGLVSMGLFSFVLTTRLALSWTLRPTALEAPRMRVQSPPPIAPGKSTLRGIARRATDPIQAGLSGRQCLVFGVRGQVGNVDVDDAEGGDFDLELEGGERIAISLEYAVLTPDGSSAREIGPKLPHTLLDWFAGRGIDPTGRRVRLAETAVCEGDEIEIEGELEAGSLVAVGYRGTKANRVIAGAEAAPLILRVKS